ncbi:hypothetical protein NMH_0152 [Neisseria meningitidis H44/76]|jgi:hypothetical protein|uniref:Uncharacterized protein n=1 Tax=Neisseria meningitidis serogroup B / serotype 15 (strain H44/76) TaxID=909420 RepID=E6MVE6_NEIMH|nr:hypothetical protein N875_05545 [Neisseria meningitidis LNP21362]EFV64553.1 hypothetical protein NMH_0152 [Neisseria meningitidis H44/76]
MAGNKTKARVSKNKNAKNGVGNFKVCALAALIRKKNRTALTVRFFI